MIGIESGKGACFSSQLQKCDGACAGREKPELHYLRLKLALMPYRLKPWPYPGKIGVREQNAGTGQVQVHVFQNWCHLKTVEDENELDDALTLRFQAHFDLDTDKLLKHHLKTREDALMLFPACEASRQEMEVCCKEERKINRWGAGRCKLCQADCMPLQLDEQFLILRIARY